MYKRGISEIMSYVLLILIAITISTLTYGFLKLYVPKEKPECREGINIIIEDARCKHEANDINNLTLVLQNRGLFKVDMAFIRVGFESREFREDIPKNNPIILINKTSYEEGLNPQELTPSLVFELPSSYSLVGNYILEVQPAHFTKGKDIESLALCPPIKQIIACA